MKKNTYFLTAALFFFLTLFSLAMTPSNFAIAQSGDEDVKTPVDKVLFDEFYKICEKCSTNCTYTGKTSFKLNGADVSAKYAMFSKDMENKRLDIESSGDKLTIFIRPDEVVNYFEKQNIAYSTHENRKIVKYNFKKGLDVIRENGRITKKVKGSEAVYTLADYTHDIKSTYNVDLNTGLINHSLIKDNPSGDIIETTYQGWESKKLDSDLFKVPSNATIKNADNL